MNLKAFLRKRTASKEKFKEMQEDDRLQHILNERKKSANQRELERFEREAEEERIKLALQKFRKRKQQSILFDASTHWTNDKKHRSIMERGNMIGKGNMLNSGNMFWK